MSKSESEILEVLNGLGSKKLDLDILFSYYSLKLSFEIRKVIAEKIGMQERKGYFLLEKMIKKFGLKNVATYYDFGKKIELLNINEFFDVSNIKELLTFKKLEYIRCLRIYKCDNLTILCEYLKDTGIQKLIIEDLSNTKTLSPIKKLNNLIRLISSEKYLPS